MQPLPAEIKAIIMSTLMKCPDVFQPACVKAMVNGDDAVFEEAFRRSGESEGQIMPWKKMIPM